MSYYHRFLEREVTFKGGTSNKLFPYASLSLVSSPGANEFC